VPPRPVDGTGEDLDPQAVELLGLGVDVVDQEEDLALGPAAGRIASDQPGQPQALIESGVSVPVAGVVMSLELPNPAQSPWASHRARSGP